MARGNGKYEHYPRAPHRLPDGDPVGRDEICALIDPEAFADDEAAQLRLTNLFNQWVNRRVLPQADGPTVNGGPSWRRATILVWLDHRGQLHERYADEVAPLRPVRA